MSAKPLIIITKSRHRGRDVICLGFKYNRELVTAVKRISGSTWSSTMKCWYIPEDDFKMAEIRKEISHLARININGLYHNRRTPGVLKSDGLTDFTNKNKALPVLPEGYMEMLQQKKYSHATCIKAQLCNASS